MYEFKKIQIINQPLSKVFNFFESPENLEEITPKNLGIKIKTPKPLVMKVGAIFEYTIKLGFLRFPWRTLITKYDPPHLFQDVQKNGPYKKWDHTHEFIDLGTKTKIIDTVEYDLYPKVLSNLINKAFIKKRVENIFEYRSKVLENKFNSNNNGENNVT